MRMNEKVLGTKEHAPKFNERAKKDLAEMLMYAKSAAAKIAVASGGEVVKLDPFKEGDEKEFLIKS